MDDREHTLLLVEPEIVVMPETRLRIDGCHHASEFANPNLVPDFEKRRRERFAGGIAGFGIDPTCLGDERGHSIDEGIDMSIGKDDA